MTLVSKKLHSSFSSRRMKPKTVALEPDKWSYHGIAFTGRSGRGDWDALLTKEHHRLTIVECFELMFSKDVIELIILMSNLYAQQRNHMLGLNAEEVKVYIAVLLSMGYITPQYLRLFWEAKLDTHNEKVVMSFHRNGCLEIQYLHLCDKASHSDWGTKHGLLLQVDVSLHSNLTKAWNQQPCQKKINWALEPLLYWN